MRRSGGLRGTYAEAEIALPTVAQNINVRGLSKCSSINLRERSHVGGTSECDAAYQWL